jgi:protein-disulfide isomerase
MKKLISCVFPGVDEVRARVETPRIALIVDDFPTFERPTKAICGKGVAKIESLPLIPRMKRARYGPNSCCVEVVATGPILAHFAEKGNPYGHSSVRICTHFSTWYTQCTYFNIIISVHMEQQDTTPKTKERGGSDLSIPLAIVFSGMVIAGAIIFTDKTSTTSIPGPGGAYAPTEAAAPSFPESLLAIKSDDHVIGNPKAEVVIIEYSDAECPFCQRFHATMNTVMGSYGKDVAWVYRHYPLDTLHPNARKAGEALECASEQGGNAAFKTFMDVIFATNAPELSEANLPTLAKNAGLNEAAFRTCLSSGKYAARVDRDFQEGVGVGIEGTPFSIAWNTKTKKQEVINGAQAFVTVAAALERLGAKKSN